MVVVGSNFHRSARLPAFCGERLWPIGGSKCINTDKSWCACARAIQTGIGAGLRGGLGPGPLPEPEKIIAALLARIGSLEQALAVELAKPRPLELPDLINWLRLHGIIFLQLVDRGREVTREIFAKAGIPAVVEGRLWDLKRSGLPADVIAAIRSAANHGMNKW